MAREGNAVRSGWALPSHLEGTIKPVSGGRLFLLSFSPGPPGVKQKPNHPGVEDGNMGTAFRLPVFVQAICGDQGRTDAGRSPRRVVCGRESRPQGEGGQEIEVVRSRGNTLCTQSKDR
jgi:hypothetical protein